MAWKKQFFSSSWANYDEAQPGTFLLVPPPKRLSALRQDYQAMQDMYFAKSSDFGDILETLAELESRINRSSKE